MNEQIHEQLSALMDGELERDQARFLLKRIASDNGLPQRWSRYHLVRQTLRRQELTVVTGFADAVMARIDLEAGASAGGGHWLRWGAGGAIAASVALAALVLTRPSLDDAVAPALVARGAPPAAATSNPPQLASSNISTPEFRAPLLAPDHAVQMAPVSFGTREFSQMTPIDPQAQLYIFHPQSTAGMTVRPGFVPYVRLADPRTDPARAASVRPAGERKR